MRRAGMYNFCSPFHKKPINKKKRFVEFGTDRRSNNNFFIAAFSRKNWQHVVRTSDVVCYTQNSTRLIYAA